MMKKELENFIIESDIQLDYFEEVVKHIVENKRRILNLNRGQITYCLINLQAKI